MDGRPQRALWWGSLFADPDHGSLPAMLLTLTTVTGLVDAVSILRLGRVFVANMTGNVVFVGFAVAGAPGFSLGASLIALAGFLTGAAGGGVVSRRFGNHRAVLVEVGLAGELVLMAAALLVAAGTSEPLGTLTRDTLAALSALAMGIQNSVARRLAVPDVTTTVLTMTLTGIAADLQGPIRGPRLLRRTLAVVTMLGGAIVGAELVIHTTTTLALGVAVAVLAALTGWAVWSARSSGAWSVPDGAL